MNGLPGYFEIQKRFEDHVANKGCFIGSEVATTNYLLRHAWWTFDPKRDERQQYAWVNRDFTGHEEIAARTGFSKTTVKRAMAGMAQGQNIITLRRGAYSGGREPDDICLLFVLRWIGMELPQGAMVTSRQGAMVTPSVEAMVSPWGGGQEAMVTPSSSYK